MRVIFLDIDGVLNYPDCFDPGRAWIDPGCIARLNLLVQRSKAVLAITSTWRGLVHSGKMTLDGLRWLLGSHGLEATIEGITGPDAQTPDRGQQILRWLQEHPRVEAFVILDDDTVTIDGLAHHVVRIDDASGLTDEDIDRASAILDQPVVWH